MAVRWASGLRRGLCAIIDDVADLAGEYLQSISTVGGYAWKVQGVLAAFYPRHLRPTVGGSLAAHASLVAREYGIPAVVAVGDSTQRIRDGQSLTVDGSAGLVEIHP